MRIAGATVGSVAAVDVSFPGEPVHANGSDDPGKAVVVMRITDPGFQDFRPDASCLIRPQSLLGEKYVDCTPTQPRSAELSRRRLSKSSPTASRAPGSASCRWRTTASRSTWTSSRTSLRLPYAQRFRLILNNLGAGLGGRGKDVEAIVRPRRSCAARDRPGPRHPCVPEPRARQAGRRLRNDPAPARRPAHPRDGLPARGR